MNNIKPPPPSAMSAYNQQQQTYIPKHAPQHAPQMSNRLGEGAAVAGDISDYNNQQQNNAYPNLQQQPQPQSDGVPQTGDGSGMYLQYYIFIFIGYLFYIM